MKYLDPLSCLRLAEKIKRESRWQFPVLLTVSLLWGVAALLVAKDPRDFLALFSAVAVLSSLVILWISIRSGAMISQAYTIAESSTPAVAHDFATFETHISWLRHSLVPAEFRHHPINLYLALSTPAYGLAVTNDENRSISGFLEWLETWIAYYEGMPPESVDRPTVQLCLWKPEAHKTTFRSAIDPTTADSRRKQDQINYIGQLAGLYGRLYQVNKTGRATCRILFTEESHTRWFMAGGGAEERAGLIIMFSPIITPRAVKDHMWRLAVVNITGQNPNVFFELGIRLSLRKNCTILLRQDGTDIPFDIAAYRCVTYDPHFHADEESRAELSDAIGAAWPTRRCGPTASYSMCSPTCTSRSRVYCVQRCQRARRTQ